MHGSTLSAGLVALAALSTSAEALNSGKTHQIDVAKRGHQFTKRSGQANLGAIARDRARVKTKFARGATNAAANVYRRSVDAEHAKREDGIHAAARALEKRSIVEKRANSGKVALKDWLDSYIDASYSGPLQAGTPAQSFQILLDSGSGDIWLPAKGSGSKHASYNAAGSSTSTVSETSWAITYESGDALEGVLVQDTMTFGGLTVDNQIFAQSNVTQTLWEELPSSGDFGFAFSRISRTGAPTFFENLIQNGDVASPVIGLYLTRGSDSTSKASAWLSGGSMCVGCTDSSKYTGSITYSPVTYQGWWEVSMDGVAINNKVATGTKVNAAIDSGTSLIYLPPKEATAFYTAVGATKVSGSWTIPCSTSKIVGLSFGGVTYNIPMSDLSLGYVDDANQNACVLGIQSLSVYDAQGTSTALVGDLFLKAVYTVFSYSQNGAPAVGFASSVTSGVASSSGSSAASGSASNSSAVASTSKYVAQAAPSLKSVAVESVKVYTPKKVAPAATNTPAATVSGASASSTSRATKVAGFTYSMFSNVASYSAKSASAASAASASASASVQSENQAASQESIALAASASASSVSLAAASAAANAAAATTAPPADAVSTSYSTLNVPGATSAAKASASSSTSGAAGKAAGAALAFAVAALAVAFQLEFIVNALEAVGRISATALDTTQQQTHHVYQQLLQSENPAAKQVVKVITHPTVVSYTHSAYTTVTQSAPVKYLAANPQHLVIILFFLVRSVILPAIIKPLKPKNANPDNSESMVDFGLGSSSIPSSAIKGNYGQCEVQWGKEKLRVNFPPPKSPLSALKAELYSRTGVAPDNQKLIYSGAVLKDDLAPLESFGLVDETVAPTADGADGDAPPAAEAEPSSFWDSWSFSRFSSKKKLKKLILLGTQPSARVDDRLTMRADLVAAAAAEAAAAEAAPPEPESEEVLRERMGKLLDGDIMQSLEDQLAVVEQWTAQQKAGTPKAGEEGAIEKPNPRSLIFLSEAFLQNLLKLDSFDVPLDYAEARKERKAGVRRVQALMDRTDAAKEAAKGLL